MITDVLLFVAGWLVGAICVSFYLYHCLTTGKRGLRGFVITKD